MDNLVLFSKYPLFLHKRFLAVILEVQNNEAFLFVAFNEFYLNTDSHALFENCQYRLRRQ